MNQTSSVRLTLVVLLTTIAFIPEAYSRLYMKLPTTTSSIVTMHYHKDDENRWIGRGRRRSRGFLQRQKRSMITTTKDVTLLLVRGGDSAAVLDLVKENYHMQALATYGTITALLLNACLTLYGKTEFPSTNVDRDGCNSFFKFNNRHVASIFAATTSICIISGMFTAVLFNILRLYSQSALARMNDEGYAAFRRATHIYTKWGFRGFLTTCTTFVAVLLMNLYTKVISADNAKKEASKEIKIGLLVLGTAIILSFFAGYHIQQILGMATKHIFTSLESSVT